MSTSYWDERNAAIEAEWDRETSMSGRIYIGNRLVPEGTSLEERRALQQQSNDIYVLQRAKEILVDLWKAGRITPEVRFTGENCLSAALHAVEEPSARKLTIAHGALLAGEQWQREQERNRNEF